MITLVDEPCGVICLVVVEIFVVEGEQHLWTHGKCLVALHLHSEHTTEACRIENGDFIVGGLLCVHALADIHHGVGGVERCAVHLCVSADKLCTFHHAECVVFEIASGNQHTPLAKREHAVGNLTLNGGCGVEFFEVVGEACQHATSVLVGVEGCLHREFHLACGTVERAFDGLAHGVEILDFNGGFTERDLGLVCCVKHSTG